MTFALGLCAVTIFSTLVISDSLVKQTQRPERSTEDESTRSPAPEIDSIETGMAPASAGDARSTASSNNTTSPSLSLALLPLPSAAKLTLIDEAYLDAFTILRGDNSCSRFFGGPRAIEPLNQLKRRLKSAYLDGPIALRMRGEMWDVENLSSKVSYRIFPQAEINLNGSFYRPRTPGEARVPDIGPFAPSTREARVTILLHELGHMIARPDKQWVLPDDGHDASVSRENTEKVVRVCRSQIDQVSRIRPAQELLGARANFGSRQEEIATAPH